MLSKIIINILIFLLLTIFFSGCACVSSTAPNNWLDDAEESLISAYGGWIQVYFEKNTLYSDGELITINEDMIYILTSDSLMILDRKNILEARLFKYDSQHRKLSTWSLGGGLLSLSHGYFGVLTIPAWALVGATATSSQSKAPLLIYPKYKLELFKPYARFPNGLPEGLDIDSKIKRKPGFD